MKNTILAILCCLSILIVSNQLCFSQIAPNQSAQANIDRIKQRVTKFGVGNKITVRMGGKEFYGTIQSIDAAGFQIYEVDQKHTVDFRYDEVDQVAKGYGTLDPLSGKRVRNQKKGTFAFIGIVGGLLVLLVVALAHDHS